MQLFTLPRQRGSSCMYAMQKIPLKKCCISWYFLSRVPCEVTKRTCASFVLLPLGALLHDWMIKESLVQNLMAHFGLQGGRKWNVLRLILNLLRGEKILASFYSFVWDDDVLESSPLIFSCRWEEELLQLSKFKIELVIKLKRGPISVPTCYRRAKT